MTDGQPGSRPIGIPVAEALEIPTGRTREVLQRTLDAIGRVHTDGMLPRIPVRENPTMRKEAQYTRSAQGRAVQIDVNPRAAQIGLSFLHEIGHFLEHKGIGLANFELLDSFQQLSKQSEAYHQLVRLSRRQSVRVTLPNGLRMRYNIDRNYLAYLLTAQEVWARAYAQYIAVRSRDTHLLSELEARRRRNPGQLYYPRQWDEADFEPLAAAIDDLFARLGWHQ